MAQEPGRTYRLGVLYSNPRSDDVMTAFFEGVRRQGFIEGQNLIVIYHAFALKVDLLSEWAAELSKARVDVITTVGDLAIRAAQEATKTIPILTITDDMVEAGLVNSMARPNGNTKGVSILAIELDGKRQEILIEAVPGMRRIAALVDTNTIVPHLQVLQEGARARGVALQVIDVARRDDVLAAIDSAKASGAEAINFLASPMFSIRSSAFIERVTALRLPSIFQWPENAEEGALAGYGPRFSDLGRQRARQLIKVLRGAKPADIPVEQPTKFDLVINMKTAKTLGLTIPKSILARADQVIE
jgi:putative ABC transport system substrate-binding protein